MATLEVTNIKNVTSSVTNLSLNSDGSSTIAVVSGTSAPTGARLGMLWYNGTVLQIYNGSTWTPSGGSPVTAVTAVTATAPLLSSGGTTPNISATVATQSQAAAGTSSSVLSTPQFSVPKDASGMLGAALLPGGGVGSRPSAPVTGMIRYNNATLPAVLEYYSGSGWTSIPTSAASGLPAASLAQAQAGISNAVANTPETSVPKDASGMAGAALIPGGGVGSRPTSPVTGMFRYNNSAGIPVALEYYNGAGWAPVTSSGSVTSVTATVPLASSGGTTPNLSAALANATDAATGTSNAVLSTPAFTVPKDAANMTGAALLPSGDDSQRPTSGLVSGMTRFNSDLTPPSLEVYNGSTWKQIGYNTQNAPFIPTLPDLTYSNPLGEFYTGPAINVCKNLTFTDMAAPAVFRINQTAQSLVFVVYGDLYLGNNWTISNKDGGSWGTVPGGGTGYYTTGLLLNYPGSGPGSPNFVYAPMAKPAVPPGIWNGGSGGQSGSHNSSLTAARTVAIGGSGGGGLVFIVHGNITVGSGCEIELSGQAGMSGLSQPVFGVTTVGGGGGGGSGGTFIMQGYGNLTIDPSFTIDVSGGAGGAGGNAAGNGGAYGGGGGGGGYAIIGCLGTYSFSPTTPPNIAGGTAGADTTSAALRGGSGGSNAGKGGGGGSSAPLGSATSAGGVGVSLLNTFILDVL
jgi:hypothetical protein